MDINDLKLENQRLKDENILLNKKIAVAKIWMEREVKSQVKKISKEKISSMTTETKGKFFSENVEDIITKKVSSFFGELLLLNTPQAVLDNVISAEISYYNLRENKNSDGLGVITSYHKALDVLIESFITKGFRKYVKKQKNIHLRQNDLLEKALNSVVNKGYILSVGRLFHILKLIKNNDKIYDFGKCFKDYLDKYNFIKEILLDDEFFKIFDDLVNSEILGKKRHVGIVKYEEVSDARELLLGNFENKNSLIYKFVEIGKSDF